MNAVANAGPLAPYVFRSRKTGMYLMKNKEKGCYERTFYKSKATLFTPFEVSFARSSIPVEYRSEPADNREYTTT